MSYTYEYEHETEMGDFFVIDVNFEYNEEDGVQDVECFIKDSPEFISEEDKSEIESLIKSFEDTNIHYDTLAKYAEESDENFYLEDIERDDDIDREERFSKKNKLTKVIFAHIVKKQITKESKSLIKKISSNLKNEGFKAPFRIKKISAIKKVAGVSFFIADTEGESPVTIGDLCNLIRDFVFKSGVKDIKHDTITPDGMDYPEYTGTINIYPSDNEQNEKIKSLVNDYISRASDVFSFSDPISEDYEDDPGVVRVTRYTVTENKTTEYEEVPEMNLSNGNASALIKMLKNYGLGGAGMDDYSGEIDISDLEKVINNINNNPKDVSENKRDTYEEMGEGKAHIIDFGLDEEQLWHYINTLKDMIDYAKQRGHTKIYYS